MKKFLASVAAVGLMGGTALGQGMVLIPQGQGPMGQQQFLLVPVPQGGQGQQDQQPQQGQYGMGQYGMGQYGMGDMDRPGMGATGQYGTGPMGQPMGPMGQPMGPMGQPGMGHMGQMPQQGMGNMMQPGMMRDGRQAQEHGARQDRDDISRARDEARRAYARQRAEQMALDLYRRGYEQGIADAATQTGPSIDPSAMEQIGRELFQRGYMLGLMQAHAEMTASEMPQPGNDEQSSAGQGGKQTARDQQGQQGQGGPQAQRQNGQGGNQQANRQQVTPGEISQLVQGGASENQLSKQSAAAPSTTAQAIGTKQTDRYGRFLTDAEGRPVYIFEADQRGTGDARAQSECYGTCAWVWPPVLSQGNPPRALGQADEGMLSTTEREDGTQQITYNGWPLYYYVNDRSSSSVAAGQDLHDEFGAWYLLDPSGEKVGG